jgi:16S rRNA (uracil1498-N3)-methyltransferase
LNGHGICDGDHKPKGTMRMAETIDYQRRTLLVWLICLLLLSRCDSLLHTIYRHEHLRSIKGKGLQLFMMEESGAEFNESLHTLPRLFVVSRLGKNVEVTFTPQQAHYVTKVMRMGRKKTRAYLRVFDGVNGEWLAQVQTEQESDTERKRKRRDDFALKARCLRQLLPQDDNKMLPWLFFAPLKKPRVKIMLEKCTELGVGRFIPLITERTDPGSIRDCVENLDKLAVQTIEAAEQCERLTVPPLSTTFLPNDDVSWDLSTLLTKWSDTSFDNRHLLILRERTVDGAIPILSMLQNLNVNSMSVAFVVGPEGGWSPTEEALCDQYATNSDYIHCVSLGPLVLRAETASITAVSAFMLCQELYSELYSKQ